MGWHLFVLPDFLLPKQNWADWGKSEQSHRNLVWNLQCRGVNVFLLPRSTLRSLWWRRGCRGLCCARWPSAARSPGRRRRPCRRRGPLSSAGGIVLVKQGSDLIELRLTWRKLLTSIFEDFWRHSRGILEIFWGIWGILEELARCEKKIKNFHDFETNKENEVLRPIRPRNSLGGQIKNQIWNLWPKLHILPR